MLFTLETIFFVKLGAHSFRGDCTQRLLPHCWNEQISKHFKSCFLCANSYRLYLLYAHAWREYGWPSIKTWARVRQLDLGPPLTGQHYRGDDAVWLYATGVCSVGASAIADGVAVKFSGGATISERCVLLTVCVCVRSVRVCRLIQMISGISVRRTFVIVGFVLRAFRLFGRQHAKIYILVAKVRRTGINRKENGCNLKIKDFKAWYFVKKIYNMHLIDIQTILRPL